MALTLTALGSQAEEIDILVRDDERGRPGWGVILDVDETLAKGLPWLSQVAGVTLRQPKLVPASVLANPNAMDPEVNTAGWASSTSVVGGSTGLSASTDISAGGFDVSHTGTAGGTWTVLYSNGLAALIPATPGGWYGVAMAYLTQPSGGLGTLTLKARWLDVAFNVISDAAVMATPGTLAAFGSGSAGNLQGAAQAPDGTAYVGIALTVPVAAATPTRHLSVGAFNVSPLSGSDSTVPIFGDPAPSQRFETEAEWAVYARDALKRQSGRNRGTPDAILSAAEDTLIGTRNARLLERVGGNAYRLNLVTRPSETPDPDLTLRMATTQVPAGMKLTHTLTEGVTIDEDTGTIDTPGSGTIDTPT
jgi:hypothetical protein